MRSKEEKLHLKNIKRVRRTIERNLYALVKEDYLKKIDHLYEISEKGLHYIRYFIRGFGKTALSDLCNLSSVYLAESAEKSIQRFVRTFGAYFVYVFIQISHIREFDYLTNEEKEEITLSFLQKGIPTTTMFEKFV